MYESKYNLFTGWSLNLFNDIYIVSLINSISKHIYYNRNNNLLLLEINDKNIIINRRLLQDIWNAYDTSCFVFVNDKIDFDMNNIFADKMFTYERINQTGVNFYFISKTFEENVFHLHKSNDNKWPAEIW